MSPRTLLPLLAAVSGVTVATVAGCGLLPRSWPVIGAAALVAGVGFAFMGSPS